MRRRATALQWAKHIAFMTRVLEKRMPFHERWLKQYEARHGPVSVTGEKQQPTNQGERP